MAEQREVPGENLKIHMLLVANRGILAARASCAHLGQGIRFHTHISAEDAVIGCGYTLHAQEDPQLTPPHPDLYGRHGVVRMVPTTSWLATGLASKATLRPSRGISRKPLYHCETKKMDRGNLPSCWTPILNL